ncbi:hypothetical protein HID58_025040 [Brassica napus]|uniref:Uncharacterized protein n=1 Tax=Brassica napus TaxID=3708 RepID=A0ABQ8CLV0_BRANA|nr:hypothetical protein HID58_025040 [Brassica napus]
MSSVCFSNCIICNMERERNKVKHDEKLIPVNVLKKLVDKNVRNKFSLLRSRCVKGIENPPSSTAALAISPSFLARSRLSSASSPTITSLTAFSTSSLLINFPFFTNSVAPTFTPNCSAPIGQVTIGNPAAMPSIAEFHPQCVTNPPTALWSSISTCGAHPRMISPLPFVLSSNPSGNHSSFSPVPNHINTKFHFIIMKFCPEPSRPAAISNSCSLVKLVPLPKDIVEPLEAFSLINARLLPSSSFLRYLCVAERKRTDMPSSFSNKATKLFTRTPKLIDSDSLTSFINFPIGVSSSATLACSAVMTMSPGRPGITKGVEVHKEKRDVPWNTSLGTPNFSAASVAQGKNISATIQLGLVVSMKLSNCCFICLVEKRNFKNKSPASGFWYEVMKSTFSHPSGNPSSTLGKSKILIPISRPGFWFLNASMGFSKILELLGVVMMVDLAPLLEKSLAMSRIGIMWP